MTDQNDIIERVKELRRWHSALKAHGMTDQFAFAQWKDRAWQLFPDIAKALIIAVEQLEKHSPGGCTCTDGCDKCWPIQTLSRIRSL